MTGASVSTVLKDTFIPPCDYWTPFSELLFFFFCILSFFVGLGLRFPEACLARGRRNGIYSALVFRAFLFIPFRRALPHIVETGWAGRAAWGARTGRCVMVVGLYPSSMGVVLGRRAWGDPGCLMDGKECVGGLVSMDGRVEETGNRKSLLRILTLDAGNLYLLIVFFLAAGLTGTIS